MKMFSFLFDEDHPELRDLGFVGPPCTGRVVRAVEERIQSPVQILRGAIVAHTLAYRTSEITLGGKSQDEESQIKSRSDSFSRSADMKIQSVLTGELFEKLSSSTYIKNKDDLLEALAKCTVWVVSGYPIEECTAIEIHNELTEFGPYLGMVEIDLAHPFFFDVFVEWMFHDDLILDGSGIYIEKEDYMPKEDQDDAIEIAKMHESKFEPKALKSDEFRRRLPVIDRPAEISERGKEGIDRITAVSKPTQREALAAELASEFGRGDHSEPLRFVAKSPESGAPVEIAQGKLTEYLLNPAHPKGAGKAKFFKDILEIGQDDWEFLRDQILRGWEIAVLYRVGRNQWEYTHGALMKVTGRNGRTAVLETGWRVSEDGPVQFVTAYPATDAADAPAATPMVVERNLNGDARWEKIYELASTESKLAHDRATPTPMFLAGYPPEWEGQCGSATVIVSGEAPEFAKWLEINGRGTRRKDGVSASFYSASQSIERSTAAAEAFAAVLGANGILCRIESRLD